LIVGGGVVSQLANTFIKADLMESILRNVYNPQSTLNRLEEGIMSSRNGDVLSAGTILKEVCMCNDQIVIVVVTLKNVDFSCTRVLILFRTVSEATC
jgi:hypothetical protein